MGNRTLQGNTGNTGVYKYTTSWGEGGIRRVYKVNSFGVEIWFEREKNIRERWS